MLITVAICTWNRAESLRRTLTSLASLRLPNTADWEVIVVNNDCTDHTDAVISGFFRQLPVRREFERRRGIATARNRVIDTARGEYLVCIDDDVVVEPGWLEAYVEAFGRYPEAALFGGPVLPLYETPVMPWVIESESVLGGPLAIRNLGPDVVPLSLAGTRIPYGANFAIRAVEQRSVRYDPDLGAQPGRLRLSEETDVIERVLQSGACGYWIPGARVRHCIGHERQTISYMCGYFERLGETEAFRAYRAGTATTFWFGVPRWLWRQLVVGWIGYHVHRFLSPAPVWVRHLRNYTFALSAVRFWLSLKDLRGDAAAAPRSGE